MSQIKLASIDRVISGLYRDLKPAVEINESDMIEWSGEALEYIGAYAQMEEKIEYLRVDDYRTMIPCGLHKIVQIAYKYTQGTPNATAMHTTCDCASTSCTTCNGTGTTCVTSCEDCDAGTCDSLCTNASQLISNAELFLEFYKPSSFKTTGYYNNNFKPLRLATGNFSKAESMHCTNCVNISGTCEHEYSIDHPYIRTDFKDGYICLAYLGQAVDERGYPMIPDEVSYIEAVKRYIIYKVKYSEFLQGIFPAQIFAKLEQDWHWYCQQARGKANMPDTIDKMENLLQQRSRLLPKRARYYGFFGNLASGESLNFSNTIGGDGRRN